MQDVVATLEPARIAVDEAAHALSHYLGKLEADPARLEEIETRLAALEKLRRKYGTHHRGSDRLPSTTWRRIWRRSNPPANGGRR